VTRRDAPLLAAAAVALLLLVAAVLRSGGDAGAQGAAPVVGAPHGGAPFAVSGPGGRVALDGPWVLRGDRADRGDNLGWPKGGFAGREVRLPLVPNARRILEEEGIRSHDGSMGWYRTTFTVPEAGDFVVRFESVNHRAVVWIDGRRMAEHTGEYLPFEARVRLAAGEHTLVVRADWRDPLRMKREGWHRTWFNFGGINREVTIRRLGASELRHPAVRTRLRGGRALVDVAVHVTNRGADRIVPLRGTLRHGDDELPVEFAELRVPRGETRVATAQLEVEEPELWSPAEPNLHDLVLEVPGEASHRVRTGLRELRRDGRRLLLNGEPVRLKGASIHEDWPGRGDGLTPKEMDATVAQLKAIGANATRAQHPLHPALVERLDAAGIMVWMGIGPVDAPGAWTNKSPAQRRSARERVKESVRQLQAHPSIVAWNLVNEVAGNGHPDGQVPYIIESTRWIKERDPGRLVALDIWGAHPPKQPGGAIYRDVDAVAYTNYIGWYEAPFATQAEKARLLRGELAEVRRLFPGKVLIVSEFGAEGNDRNPPEAPGGLRFQADLLRTHLSTYAADRSLSGFLVWNLRDFAVAPSFAGGSIRRVVGDDIDLLRGLNEKGLFTYDGRPKPSAGVVKGFYEPLRPSGF
jgi:hypothetical protein